MAFDGAAKIGAKILISGGGRCNVTHDVVTPEDFNGNLNAIAKVLRKFTVEQTLEWAQHAADAGDLRDALEWLSVVRSVAGELPAEWRGWLRAALERGLEIWSGLHTFIGDDPELGREVEADDLWVDRDVDDVSLAGDQLVRVSDHPAQTRADGEDDVRIAQCRVRVVA